MTITEFLEARIAEDEAEAMDVPLNGDLFDMSRLAFTPALRSRVLAECAAKRAILAFDEDMQIWEPRLSSSDTDAGSFTMGAPKDPHARHVTRILAAVYADHPDYRQDWAL
jgi:hypothetical protein